MKVNCLVAAWTGVRRSVQKTGSFFLDYHLNTLKQYKHKLSQITVILPECPYNNTVSAPDQIQDTPVVLLERQNIGLSYGSWSYAYDLYQDAFDYYILIEDDYVFCLDNFDDILLDLIHSSPNCGYLCSQYEESPWEGRKMRGWRPHAGVANGIVREEALAKVKSMHGKLPYAHSSDYNCRGQIDFSAAIIDAGYMISDFRHRYACPYYSELTRSLTDFAPKRKDVLIAPVQWHLTHSGSS